MYGIKVQDLNADYVVMARESLDGFAIAGVPGAFWVEYFPILQFIPSWVPGANFKRIAEQYRPVVQQALRQPFQVVKDSIARVLTRSLSSRLRFFVYTKPTEPQKFAYLRDEGPDSLYPTEVRRVRKLLGARTSSHGGDGSRLRR